MGTSSGRGPGAYTRPLLSSTSAVLVTPPRVLCLIDWGKPMHPTYPTKYAYVELKRGRVSAPAEVRWRASRNRNPCPARACASRSGRTTPRCGGASWTANVESSYDHQVTSAETTDAFNTGLSLVGARKRGNKKREASASHTRVGTQSVRGGKNE